MMKSQLRWHGAGVSNLCGSGNGQGFGEVCQWEGGGNSTAAPGGRATKENFLRLGDTYLGAFGKGGRFKI